MSEVHETLLKFIVEKELKGFVIPAMISNASAFLLTTSQQNEELQTPVYQRLKHKMHISKNKLVQSVTTCCKTKVFITKASCTNSRVHKQLGINFNL